MLVKKLLSLIVVTSLVVMSCSTTEKSRETAIENNTNLQSLEERIEAARRNNVDILANKSFSQGVDRFNEAVETSRENGSTKEVNDAASKGLAKLSVANRVADRNRILLKDVMSKREDALDIFAPDYYPERFKEADAKLVELANQGANGNTEAVRAKRNELQNTYAKIELDTIQTGVLAEAKSLQKTASNADADDYAPKTFKKAQKELKLAKSSLESGKDHVYPAREHTRESEKLFKRAIQISKLAKEFSSNDASKEDMILWYHEQLADVVSPMYRTIPTEKPNRELVTELKNAVQSTVDLSVASNIDSNRLQAKEDRIDYARAQFSEDEAEVFRRDDNLLIKVHGFDFGVGDAELEPRNFKLMDKIVAVVDHFPESQLKITGHTDSRGTDEFNAKLSQERAKNVAKFMTTVGRVKEGRVRAVGMGEEKPVASNETTEGRAKNRRIEILIDRI